MLYGRSAEEQRISALLAAAAQGRSAAVAVIAAAGEGKSALLARAAELVDHGWRVLRVTGIQTGSEVAFAGLRQLLEPALHHMQALPKPQYLALCGALGLESAENPERFLVGLATLSLLAELSAEGPVLCLIDDAHWIDQPSIDALLFTARRLENEGVAMLFAGRTGFTAPGLPLLPLTPLDAEQARALLAERIPNLALEIRERVVLESAGNPLALLELPGMNLDSLPVGPLALSARLQSGYEGHIAHLPAATRLALLVASASECGNLGMTLRVLGALGLDAQALADAERTTMIAVSEQQVAFRHPLLRAAAYSLASDAERISVHTALAEELINNPDRHAWHRSAATVGNDETVAAALEATAERACSRTGHGAAATAWERAAQLTPDPIERARRLVRAAETAGDAGQFTRAYRLAGQARALTTDPVHRARLASVLAHIEFEHGTPVTAHRLLHMGAVEAAPSDPDLAAAMLFDAGRVAWVTGDVAAFRSSRAVLAGLPPSPDRDKFLVGYDGTLALFDEDPTPGIVLLRLNPVAPQEISHHSPQVRFVLATQSLVLGDLDLARAILSDLSESCRSQGQLGWLALAELWQGTVEFMSGRFREAEVLSTEGRRIAENIDQPIRIVHADANLALLAALHGDEERCLSIAEAGYARSDLTSFHRSQFDWARSLLAMGAGSYAAALDLMEELDKNPTRRHAQWLTVYADRVEAAVRTNQPARAQEPLAELRLWSDALQAPWAEALLLRSIALLEGDEAAYVRALELHAGQDRCFDRARTGLLYGEWLRRERRTTDARTELRDALQTFERLGAQPWAQRARDELRAAGVGTLPEAHPDLAAQLTPQELQVVRLAATGATNKEIGAGLFVSPKTVGHHLSRAFRKLGVSSRVDLARLELS